MPIFNTERNDLDRTVKIFDSFYAKQLVIPSNDFDVVYGYFSSVCKTKQIAANFTAVFFRVCQESGISPMDFLQQIKGTSNKLQMNSIITYYLNSFKSKTTLYGISIIPKANQNVARNVVL